MNRLSRKSSNKYRSSKSFRRTHEKTKLANIKRPVMRGGIRF